MWCSLVLAAAQRPHAWLPSVACQGGRCCLCTILLHCFAQINPNGRIPAMVDHSAGDLRVFETGSIMLYLCEHYDQEHKLLPAVSDTLLCLPCNLLLVRMSWALMCMCHGHVAGC